MGRSAILRTIAIMLAATAVFLLTGVLAYRQKTKAEPQAQTDTTTTQVSDDSQIIRVLAVGIDDTQMLTDVIMVAMLDLENGSASVLQIPRDSYIGDEYPTGKLNSVYGHPLGDAGRMNELEQVIEDRFKLPIDYHVSVSLSGFSDIINDLGGIPMDVPALIEYLPGKVLWPGEQTLNGEQAEWLVRYRRGYVLGDIGRVNVQTEFLKAAIQALKDGGRVNAVNALIRNYDKVKTNMPLSKAIYYASSVFEFDISDIQFYTVQGKGAMNRSYAVYELDKEQLATILNEHFRPEGEEVSAEELNIPEIPPQPAPPPVQEEYVEELYEGDLYYPDNTYEYQMEQSENYNPWAEFTIE